jgi:hypothetical protein
VNSDNEESDNEYGTEGGEDDFDDQQGQSELTWEGQLKDSIDDLNEKRTR